MINLAQEIVWKFLGCIGGLRVLFDMCMCLCRKTDDKQDINIVVDRNRRNYDNRLFSDDNSSEDEHWIRNRHNPRSQFPRTNF